MATYFRMFCFPVSYLENVKIKIYKTTILTSIVYGCETWSVTRGKRIVFGTRVLRRVFGSARESNRRVQNLQNETFQNLYISPIIKVITSRETRWSGLVSCMGDMTNTHRMSVGIPEGIDHLRNVGVDGRRILKRIVDKYN
jgi:hypothetical protein